MTLEQRIKIAEACGWVRGYSGDLQWVNDPNGIRIGCSSIRNVADQALPDYLNDLNAMQSAILIQTNEFQLAYHNALVAENCFYHCIKSTRLAEIFVDIAFRFGIITP